MKDAGDDVEPETERAEAQPTDFDDFAHDLPPKEFKRKQAAPGLKVTDRAFGTGWRMPIAASCTDVVSGFSRT